MNTKLLKDKISRYTESFNKGKLNSDFTKEMLTDINTWISGIEKYIETIELENVELTIVRETQYDEIERLRKIITIIGEGKSLVAATIMDKNKFDKTIEFLFNCCDRANVGNIYAVGCLLDMAEKEGREVNNMVELVNYARGL